MKSYGNSESPFVAFYGCASILIILIMSIVVGIMGVHGITQYVRDITLSNNQVAVAEALRDQAVGVALAQEQGQTDRLRIQEDTRIRLDWSYFPNKLINVVIAVLVAAFIVFLLSIYFSPSPAEPLPSSKADLKGRSRLQPRYYDEIDDGEDWDSDQGEDWDSDSSKHAKA